MRRLLIVYLSLLSACQIPFHAADVFDEKADLAIDEAPHTKNSLEWWYFTGHLEDTAIGKTLGVEYVVFHFNPTNLKGGWLINMAVSDPELDTFYFDHQFYSKSKNQFETLPLNMHWEKKGFVSSLKGQEGFYQIHAKMSEHPISFELESKAGKGVVLHDGIGYENYGDFAKAGYYSYPRMPTNGRIKIADSTFEVKGNLWYDRQWNCSGVFERKIAWDWFAIQFEESKSELMLYKLYHIKNGISLLGGTYTDSAGRRFDLKSNQISIQELACWKSTKSKANYPTKWQIVVKDIDIAVQLEVAFPNQELKLNFAPFMNFYYWEGMSYANGKIRDKQVHGKAYVEMTNRFRIKD